VGGEGIAGGIVSFDKNPTSPGGLGGGGGGGGYLLEFVKFLSSVHTTDRHLLSCLCGSRKGGEGRGVGGAGTEAPYAEAYGAYAPPGPHHLAQPFLVPTSSFVKCVRTTLSVRFAAENATVRERQVHE
jgi:hypothetical protein